MIPIITYNLIVIITVFSSKLYAMRSYKEKDVKVKIHIKYKIIRFYTLFNNCWLPHKIKKI